MLDGFLMEKPGSYCSCWDGAIRLPSWNYFLLRQQQGKKPEGGRYNIMPSAGILHPTLVQWDSRLTITHTHTHTCTHTHSIICCLTTLCLNPFIISMTTTLYTWATSSYKPRRSKMNLKINIKNFLCKSIWSRVYT